MLISVICKTSLRIRVANPRRRRVISPNMVSPIRIAQNLLNVKCYCEKRTTYLSKRETGGRQNSLLDRRRSPARRRAPDLHGSRLRRVPQDARPSENDAVSRAVDANRQTRKSFIDGNFENAKSVPIKESQLSGDWKPLPADSPLSWTKSRLGDVVFTSDAPGAKLTFRFKGSQVKIYDILGPNGGQVRVTVDGKPHNNPIPRFDSFCTYWRLATLTLADGLDPNVVHEATVEIDAEQPSRQPVAFRLADPEKELAEPNYNGRNVWFGPILVLGDVVE